MSDVGVKPSGKEGAGAKDKRSHTINNCFVLNKKKKSPKVHLMKTETLPSQPTSVKLNLDMYSPFIVKGCFFDR